MTDSGSNRHASINIFLENLSMDSIDGICTAQSLLVTSLNKNFFIHAPSSTKAGCCRESQQFPSLEEFVKFVEAD